MAKGIIRVDVPDFQIGQEVSIFFKDTMKVKGVCEEEPTTGHWELFDKCLNSGYHCSECHKTIVKEGWSHTVKKIKYCPNCGAKMGV